MKILTFVKQNIEIATLVSVCVLLFAVNIRMNLFSYNNFDFGKFDLGNMSQMLWNTQHGNFMYLTDYFGTNLPRWAMSHFDPILLLFLPLFILFPHPLTLVFAQIFLLLASAVLIYLLANLEIKSKFIALMVALSYLSYPALGFITAKTGFHGISAAIFFFLFAFYVLELMYCESKLSKRNLFLFWTALLIALTGKEQVGAYVFMYGIFLYFFRSGGLLSNYFKKLAISVSMIGIVWSLVAFFVIIPHYAKYRIDGYERFAQTLNIQDRKVTDVAKENYFLSRYEVFGENYAGVIKGIVFNPGFAIKVFFGGDKVENFRMTFEPVLYLPFAAPQVFVLAVPDLMMNYLTNSAGIGTSEIQNHRISMIIPIIFLSIILTFVFLKNLLYSKPRFLQSFLHVLAIGLLVSNFHYSFKYNNPVFMWLKGSIVKRLPVFVAEAKTDVELAKKQDLNLGSVVRISPLENKDRECASKIVNIIEPSASVTGPDYLGAHLSLRETYAIFPALYNQADYVIVDVFSKKIANILQLDPGIVVDSISKILRDPNYKLEVSCGNLFVFKRVGQHAKSGLLPIQERSKYFVKYDFPILFGFTLVDFKFDREFKRGVVSDIDLTYQKKDQVGSSFLFLSFINSDSGEMYQAANLPSFALNPLDKWSEDMFYTENLEMVLPTYLEPGEYKMFLGFTNYIKTRSIYLGTINLK